MPTLANVTFSDLRTELLAEFGNGISTTEVNSKINHALLLLHAKYPFWRWLLHPFSINIAAAYNLTGVTWVAGTNSISWVSPTITIGTLVRWGFRLNGDSNEYICATQPTTTTATFDKAPASSGTAVTAQVTQAYIELPANFSHMHILRSPQVRRFRRIRHKNPWTFENIQSKEVQPATADQAAWYTVLMDPLATETNRQYLTVYPRLTALTRLTGLYYRAAEDLSVDADVAPIARFYRRVLFYKAAELVAAKLRDWEAVQYYATQAETIIASTKLFDRFADDSDDSVTNDIDDPLRFQEDNFVTVPRP